MGIPVAIDMIYLEGLSIRKSALDTLAAQIGNHSIP
jgi:hypothetical protein